ncbi:hypothetical protein GGS21DRAFT_310740 [Xylaria nigripes]|nr:hypothetical protein GGS21DRAFT_310740 [Xylaria nigripes]
MDPSGPPQPPQDAAYHVKNNPVTLNPSEQRSIHQHEPSKPVARRVANDSYPDVQYATPSSLGRGIRGAPADEERHRRTREDVGRHVELEGESQMCAASEGRVADAVRRKPGASGAQPDLAGDLDRKKREQAAKRDAVKEARRHEMVSDGGVCGGGVNTELDSSF